jgi:hypothetical protein
MPDKIRTLAIGLLLNLVWGQERPTPAFAGGSTFDSGIVVDPIITDSAKCTKNCLDNLNYIFCQGNTN